MYRNIRGGALKKRVLVIEDDAAIRQGVVDALEFEGYETLYSGNGEEGLEMAVAFNYDLLLLDAYGVLTTTSGAAGKV